MTTTAFVPAIAADRLATPVHLNLFSGRPLIYWCLRGLSRSERVGRTEVVTNDERIERAVAGMALDGVAVVRTILDDPDEAFAAFLQRADLPDSDLLVAVPTASPFLFERDLDLLIDEFEPSSSGGWIESGAFSLLTVGQASGKPELTAPPVMEDHTRLDLTDSLGLIAAEAVHRHLLPDSYPALGDIRMLLTDVDGVLTDAGMYYGESGEEMKKFSTRDGMAFPLLRERGLKIGIITGEDTAIVARRAEKLKADFLYQGIGDKRPVVEKICATQGIDLAQVAYVGDDIGDLTALSAVGFAACPATAEPAVKRVAHYICERGGGEGCVREVAELILAGLDRNPD